MSTPPDWTPGGRPSFKREYARFLETGHAATTLRPILPLLRALSVGYGLAVRIRAWSYRHLPRSRSLPIPVISVGNLTVGGSGKTPLTVALASRLVERGHRVAILSRGYGGAEPSKTLIVSDGSSILVDDPGIAGDEPLLMARRAPGAAVLVCRNRHRAGLVAVKELNSQVVLLDDGFQHMGLYRDTDILVCRGRTPWGNARLLPAGPLREPLSAAARAHLLVYIPEGEAHAEVPPEVQLRSGIPLYTATLELESISLIPPGGETLPPDSLSGKRVLPFAGIARPEGFIQMLREAGTEIPEAVIFPDHHPYSPADLRKIWERAKRKGAHWVLTTEKDSTKVQPLLPEIDTANLPLAVAPVSLRLPEEAVLQILRQSRLHSHPGAAERS